MSTAVAEQPTTDTSQVEIDSWREKPFPAGRAFRVFIADEAYRNMWKHARETLIQGDLISEVGGILVGDIFRDESGPYLEITAAIIAEHTRSENTEVAFTPETWDQVNRVKDSLYPDQRIVGWYHTHPRFGIFLSDRDKFIHRHSFPQPWAAAFVIDPVQDLEGLFLWSNGEPREAPEYWVGEERKLHLPREIVEEVESSEREKGQMPVGSRTTYLLSLSFLLATLVLAGGLYYRNELRRAREIDLIARALNSQQEELDRAEQNIVLLHQHLNANGQNGAEQNDQVNNSIKQLATGLFLVKALNVVMQSRIDVLENKGRTDENPQSFPAPAGENERKP